MINCKGHFPTFWIIVLVLAGGWFAKDIGWINVDIPWFPAILIIVAIGAIIHHTHGRK